MTNRKLKSGTGIGCTWIPGLPFPNKKWYDITIIFNIRGGKRKWEDYIRY